MWLGNRVESEHLRRIGDLLASDILNPHAVSVVDNAAKSLTNAQENVCENSATTKIGILGLLSAMRQPEIQRSIAFAVNFAQCFGSNLERESNRNDKTSK